MSERIAAERGERIGGTIGYNIRLESEKCRTTQVIFVTPGVLLRKLQSDPYLEEYSHVIIDEAHERDRFTEFLLIVLRTVCAQRKSLKLLLMSATMQTTKLSSYFGNVPHIHIGGSVFPVQEFFLEHALRFTDYAVQVPSSGWGKGNGNGTSFGSGSDSALAAYMRSCQEYNCSLCQSGPFKSPEELGTHCALCNGQRVVVHGANRGSSNGNGNGRRHVSAEELVRMMASAGVKQLNNTNNSSSKYPPQGNQNQGQSQGKIIQDKTKSGKDKSGKDGEEVEGEEDDNWVDVDDEEEASDNEGVEEVEKEEEDAVQSMSDPQSSNNIIEDDSDGTEALLKSYQYAFDDTLIDHDLIVSLLTYIFESEYCKDGSVLVFLPGWEDISKMHRLLTNHPHFGNTRQYKIIQLHSGIPRKTQVMVILIILYYFYFESVLLLGSHIPYLLCSFVS